MDETQPAIPTNPQDYLVWQNPGAASNMQFMNAAAPAKPQMSLQDWLALSYLTTALGGAVGQAFKKGIPPPPVGFQTTSPGPPTTPTATQASLGLAQVRRSRPAGGYGRG